MAKIIGKLIQLDSGKGTAEQTYLDMTKKRKFVKHVDLDNLTITGEWIEKEITEQKWDELWNMDYEYIMGLRNKKFDFVMDVTEANQAKSGI